jgi:hypothetical protein
LITNYYEEPARAAATISTMEPVPITGWIVGGLLILLALPLVTSRLTLTTRAILVCAGLLAGLGGMWFARWRHEHELPLTDRSVLVTARAPGASLFPVELKIANGFLRLSRVQLRCMVERFATDRVDFLDADVANRADLPALERGASYTFECPAPPELQPPFPSADVRGAHVTLDVTFSVPDRWRRIGVRQGFDLTSGTGQPVWTPDAPVLLR